MVDPREALERARLAKMRRDFGVDRTDHTLFREGADRLLQPLVSGANSPSLSEEENQRLDAGLSAGLTGFVTSGAAGVGALLGKEAQREVNARELAPREREIVDQLKQRNIENRLPQLDPALLTKGPELNQRSASDFGFSVKGLPLVDRFTLRPEAFEEVHGVHPDEFLRHEAQANAFAAGRDPGKPTYADDRAAMNVLREMEKQMPVPEVDWINEEVNLAANTPKRLTSIKSMPEFGADLGGFSRSWGGPEVGNHVAYTVVPEANSGRFANALLPPLVDQVYRKDKRLVEPDPFDEIFVDDIGPKDATKPAKPVPVDRLASLDPSERVRLLEQMAPGQTRGANQSAYLWGTLYDHPRYEYARGSRSNPEIVVSEVRTPPELETKYLFTSDTHDPKVSYKQGGDAIGPSWGVSEYNSGSTPNAWRQRRNTAGDISFRGDLVEARGGFSLADAQAVQQELGIAPTVPKMSNLEPERAFEQAIESIRRKDGLESHAEVVDRYARRLPRLGRTTNPRQPADVTLSQFELDTTPMAGRRLIEGYDIAGALRQANLPANQGGYEQAFEDAERSAVGRVTGLRRLQLSAPALGMAANLADPEAAKLLGAAVAEKNPAIQRSLSVDALRVYGQNAVVGGAQGALLAGGLEAAKRLGYGAAASAVLPALAVAGPSLTGAAVVGAADNYLQAATGEGLKRHTQKVQAKVNPQAAQVIPQLLPKAKAVIANTPSGVARLTRTQPVNPLINEAQKRAALFRGRFNPLRGEFGLSELLLGR